MKVPKLLAAITAMSLVAAVSTTADDKQNKSKEKDSSVSAQQEKEKSSIERDTPITRGQEIDEASGAQKQESLDPKEFLKETAQGNMMGLKLAQLAVQQAQSPSIKQFAQRLIQDHGKAHQELKQLAERKSVALASDLEQKHQKKVDQISSLSGEEFDKAFAQCVLKDHKKVVAKFEKMAQKSTDAEVQSFARNTLPALRTHLQMVRQFAPDTEQAERDITEPAGADPASKSKSLDYPKKASEPDQKPQDKSPDRDTPSTPDK